MNLPPMCPSMHVPNVMPTARGFPFLLAFTSLAGCDDPATIRQDDVRHYVAPASTYAVGGTASEASPAAPLRYELPAGWSQTSGSEGMRLATFRIGDSSPPQEITIVPASGTLRDNLIRWQGQLDGGAPNDAAATAVDRAVAGAESVAVDGSTATIVLLEGPASDQGQEAILGAVIPMNESSSLFVKFRGKLTVAEQQRDAFRDFVESLRWK